jgi:hypothetical protein
MVQLTAHRNVGLLGVLMPLARQPFDMDRIEGMLL